MISYIKRYQIENFYNYICLDFLKKNKNNILKLEKICILMQFESLLTNNTPVFYCKIYLDNDDLKIEYLSDIFRVMRPQNLGYHRFCNIYKMGKILKQYKKVKKMSDEELDNKIIEIKNTNNLNKRYFRVRKYNNKIMRYHARILSRSNEYLILNIIKFVLDSIAFILLLMPFGYITLRLLNFQNKDLINLISVEYLTFSLLILILESIWTFFYAKPTEFEAKN